MSYTKQWIMDNYDEFNYSHGEREGYKLRKMEEEYHYWQLKKEQEEIELLNTLLQQDAFNQNNFSL